MLCQYQFYSEGCILRKVQAVKGLGEEARCRQPALLFLKDPITSDVERYLKVKVILQRTAQSINESTTNHTPFLSCPFTLLHFQLPSQSHPPFAR